MKSIFLILCISGFAVAGCDSKSDSSDSDYDKQIQHQMVAVEEEPVYHPDTLTADGYRAVKIGQQIWMVDNLNTAVFRNGDTIADAGILDNFPDEWVTLNDAKQPAWCYRPRNEKFAKLYNWFAVSDPRGLAPNGWHIPSADEWSVLIQRLDGRDHAAKALKSTSEWAVYDDGTNSSGFNAFPNGHCAYSGQARSFGEDGKSACFWTRTDDGGDYAKSVDLIWQYAPVGIGESDKRNGLSVRCVKD